jgi:glycosyltransferase involved in cell wall biosynthesis
LYVSHIPNDEVRELKFDNIYVSINKKTDTAYSPSGIKYLLARIFLSLSVLFLFLFKNKKSQYDVIYFIEIEPLMLNLLILFVSDSFWKQTVITIHSADYDDNYKTSSFLKNYYKRFGKKVVTKLLSKGANFACHSEWHYDELTKQLDLSLDNQNQLKWFEYPTKDIVLDSNYMSYVDEKFNFLYLGLLKPTKGVFEYLKAIKIIVERGYESINFYLIGASFGIEFEEINNFILKNKLKKYVIFKNEFVTEDEKKEFYKKCNYAIVPYNDNYAGGAGTLKESISHGRPVLASSLKQFEMLSVKSKSVTTFEVNDMISLVENMIALSSIDFKEQLKFREDAKFFANTIGWRNASKFYEGYVNEV